MNNENYDQLVAIAIGDVYRQWRAAIDTKLLEINTKLTRTEWHIIGKLQCRGPKMSQQQLADYLSMDAAQLTRVLRQLEDKGIIRKTLDEQDRRIRQLELVEPDAEYIKQMIQINKNIGDKMMSTFTKQEVTQLTTLLKKMTIAS